MTVPYSLVDAVEGAEDDVCVGEDAVRQQERVEEVDAQETQVGQTIQKLLDRRVSHLHA